MCGIIGLITNKTNNNSINKKYILKCLNKLQHRGPDGTGYYENDNIFLGHKRLAIIDPKSGNQPILSNDGNLALCVNGEIFNYKDLKQKYSSYNYITNSDCEPILALYSDYSSQSYYNSYVSYNSYNSKTNLLTHSQIVALLEQLDGQFSFILYDKINNMVLVARDPFGITQLYYGLDSNGNIHISSELKGLKECTIVNVFPSGHYMYLSINEPSLNTIPYFLDTKDGSWLKPSKQQLEENYFSKEQYYYNPQPILNDIEQQELMTKIKNTFENAVTKRLMSDVPFGILLSGGLDSSLVASIAVKYIRANPEIYGDNPIIHTFSIGDKDSTDLPYAKKVADFLNTNHHEISFTVEDGLNAIDNVIYHLETYDITTIRASTPHYLLAQKIQSMGIKMVLSGEGSDELLGGYLYFHKAPTDEEHQIECKKRVLDLGYFDCLRADKSTMAHSVEGRYPFLDTEFIKLCIDVHKDVKTQKGIEKYILRNAFNIKEVINGELKQTYLPDEILWRQKEQFSDSITYRWIDTLKANTKTEVNTNSLVAYNHRDLLYPYNTPNTHEAFYYRQIFEKMFLNREKTVKCWYPNTRWDGNSSSDPSGRVQSCHINKVTV